MWCRSQNEVREHRNSLSLSIASRSRAVSPLQRTYWPSFSASRHAFHASRTRASCTPAVCSGVLLSTSFTCCMHSVCIVSTSPLRHPLKVLINSANVFSCITSRRYSSTCGCHSNLFYNAANTWRAFNGSVEGLRTMLMPLIWTSEEPIRASAMIRITNAEAPSWRA